MQPKAINRKDFNPETMIYVETDVVYFYNKYTNVLTLKERFIYRKPNGKLCWLPSGKSKTISVPPKYIRRGTKVIEQMSSHYYQQDDMMETRQVKTQYCDKNFIKEQKELFKSK